ncbi:hypothetical protein [Bradyrhizobium japonicum]|uniref:hypothetical protein n=1 Tax=Bradyrhizobium japonicum TaxID=375 RepID=UPI0009038C92|nr:hypothetical protein [Bradyrhizobium japonicum]
MAKSPAGQGGAKTNDITINKIASDSTGSVKQQQASQLTRRYGLGSRMALIIAPFVFGEAN